MKSVTGNWDRALAGASQGFPGSTVAKNLPRQEDTRDRGSIPDLGRSPTVRNGNPLYYSCLGNPWTGEADGLQSLRLQRVRHD